MIPTTQRDENKLISTIENVTLVLTGIIIAHKIYQKFNPKNPTTNETA